MGPRRSTRRRPVAEEDVLSAEPDQFVVAAASHPNGRLPEFLDRVAAAVRMAPTRCAPVSPA
jgi:hypothetical protein